METIKTFEHDGHTFEVRMVADLDGWWLKVFVDGKPTRMDGNVSHELQQDAQHYGVDDPRQVIADALEQHVKLPRG